MTKYYKKNFLKFSSPYEELVYISVYSIQTILSIIFTLVSFFNIKHRLNELKIAKSSEYFHNIYKKFLLSPSHAIIK